MLGGGWYSRWGSRGKSSSGPNWLTPCMYGWTGVCVPEPGIDWGFEGGREWGAEGGRECGADAGIEWGADGGMECAAVAGMEWNGRGIW